LVINTVMRRKDSQVDLQKCVVEKAIEISQAEFSALCNGLLEDKDYISKYKSIDYFKEQTTTEYKTDLSVTNYKWLQRSIINNTKIAPNAKTCRCTTNTFSRFATPVCQAHDKKIYNFF